MRSKINAFLATLVVFLIVTAAGAALSEFAIRPETLDLTLERGETVIKRVSLTVSGFCFRPFEIDVLASDPDARVNNLTGRLINGCGGQTSVFEIEFRGTGRAQVFELEFVDYFMNRLGSVIGTIPVTINTPAAVEPLLGLLTQPNGILFQVASNGCTTRDDFEVEIMESFPLQLRLVRLREDPCNSFVPSGTRIRFSYRMLRIKPGEQFRVVNPLATVEVQRRRRRR